MAEKRLNKDFLCKTQESKKKDFYKDLKKRLKKRTV
jgi:hypothetical protein